MLPGENIQQFCRIRLANDEIVELPKNYESSMVRVTLCVERLSEKGTPHGKLGQRFFYTTVSFDRDNRNNVGGQALNTALHQLLQLSGLEVKDG
jgi:hypothetical protein